MVTAQKTKAKQKRYPGCLPHAVTDMFYSVVIVTPSHAGGVILWPFYLEWFGVIPASEPHIPLRP